MYIPGYEYNKTTNRSWIWNVINTLWQDKFRKFIDDKISERVKLPINIKSLNIKALPKFINILKSSKNISTDNRRSHFLLKTSGKRKWEEVKKDDAEQLRNTQKENRLLQDKIEKLHEKMVRYEDAQNELLAEIGKLCKLYQEEIIYSDGEYIPGNHD